MPRAACHTRLDLSTCQGFLSLPPAPLPRLLPPTFAAQVCLVGSRQFNTFGAHGSEGYVDFRHYPTLEACCTDLKQNKGR